MRRNGALAVAAALAVTLGVTTAAVADPGEPTGDSTSDGGQARAERAAPREARFVSSTYINFGSDATGSKANGFTSADSALVGFTDTGGTGLRVFDFGAQSFGQALASTDGHGGIAMNFADPAVEVQMYFGNDDPNFSQVGLKAHLVGYYHGTKVADAKVTANRNDTMDQNISLNGSIVDEVVFEYLNGDGTVSLITPVLDAIYVGPMCDRVGTNAKNTLIGDSGDNVLCGMGGNDRLEGRGGQDVIYPGDGADTASAGAGNDWVKGSDGNDVIHGGGGSDYLYGGRDRDTLDGGAGTDNCYGGPGRDNAGSKPGACEVKVSIP